MNDTPSSKGDIRRTQMMNLLKQQGKITITEIIERFDVSEATARRDLDLLDRKGELIRTIGGALYEGMSTVREVAFSEKSQKLWLEKEAVARKASELIEEGDSICLSGGTTTYLIAKQLKSRQGITVVTNAVNIAMELADSEGIQVVVIGGVMRAKNFELCGPLAEKTIEHINIGKMFLGIDGFNIQQGISTYSELEAQTARMLMNRALQTIAVLDHTKVGKASLFSIAPLTSLYGCICDKPFDEPTTAYMNEHGIQAIIADQTPAILR
ncbi:DeoR/GlpR family DNA-binding transcription regulator [Paenibacillus sp. N1-5-1-14]|uniref:DeoR/GlpR family DNA-binding transcription regulator n=1 Tax=Paenibacillus radicibacter TaxID=2972488 RepID=UPI002158AE3D|nr:DeoR/GlpR family DNA-binding transcription regulator [Paenibacillus radicibacter]MCR8642457.1 DeoR/GlpR family DNA-binding transcription regulator [Paenibacillus radicibacter]